jgi:ribosomal protein S27AE
MSKHLPEWAEMIYVCDDEIPYLSHITKDNEFCNDNVSELCACSQLVAEFLFPDETGKVARRSVKTTNRQAQSIGACSARDVMAKQPSDKCHATTPETSKMPERIWAWQWGDRDDGVWYGETYMLRYLLSKNKFVEYVRADIIDSEFLGMMIRVNEFRKGVEKGKPLCPKCNVIMIDANKNKSFHYREFACPKCHFSMSVG